MSEPREWRVGFEELEAGYKALAELEALAERNVADHEAQIGALAVPSSEAEGGQRARVARQLRCLSELSDDTFQRWGGDVRIDNLGSQGSVQWIAAEAARLLDPSVQPSVEPSDSEGGEATDARGADGVRETSRDAVASAPSGEGQPEGAEPSNDALAEWLRATADYNRTRPLDGGDARLLNLIADRLSALRAPVQQTAQPLPVPTGGEQDDDHGPVVINQADRVSLRGPVPTGEQREEAALALNTLARLADAGCENEGERARVGVLRQRVSAALRAQPSGADLSNYSDADLRNELIEREQREYAAPVDKEGSARPNPRSGEQAPATGAAPSPDSERERVARWVEQLASEAAESPADWLEEAPEILYDAARLLRSAPSVEEEPVARAQEERDYYDATDEELVLEYGRAVIAYQRDHDGRADEWAGSIAIDRLRSTRARLLKALSEGQGRKMISAGRRIATEIERMRSGRSATKTSDNQQTGGER